MATKTKIQWCDHTFNPWIGCSKVNEGCKFCYAETLMADRYHRVVWGEDGTRSRTKTWSQPLQWEREAVAAGESRKVFCASLADVFEDRPELVPWRADLFTLIDRCPNLYWLLLTKRPENIGVMWPDGFPRYRENVWLGTSIANQRNADEYVSRLAQWHDLAPFLFLSLEPQIGPVNIRPALARGINWVIVGGESKQGKEEPRPFHVDWAREVLAQCRDEGVPCFIKQFGSNVWQGGRRLRLRDSHGGDMAEWPEDLRVRECPETFVELAA